MNYHRYRAVYTLSRWYSDLQQAHFRFKTGHLLLDYPLPDALAQQAEKHFHEVAGAEVLLYVKGGPTEQRIADSLAARFKTRRINYGAYKRADLLAAAGECGCCVYLSRE